MRKVAELRGSKSPYLVKQDGEVKETKSLLESYLIDMGYRVVDRRIHTPHEFLISVKAASDDDADTAKFTSSSF